MSESKNVPTSSRVAAEVVRTTLRRRVGFLIPEYDMPYITAAIGRIMDMEHERGYREGWDRATLECEAADTPPEARP